MVGQRPPVARTVVAVAVAGALWASPAVHAEPTYSETTVSYNITGQSPTELLQSIASNGPRLDKPGMHSVARAIPKFSWSWNLGQGPAGCRITNTKVGLVVTIYMPRWQDRGSAQPALKADWDRYAADVLAHERRHAAISRRTAKAIERGILALPPKPTCVELRATILPAVEAIVRNHDEEQAVFDRKEGSCLLRKSCLKIETVKR